MIAGAEMGKDEQLVFESVRALDEIIQVHMAELVYLLAAVVRANKAHLGDQDLRLESGREVVQARGARIACIGEQRRADLAGHLRSREAQIANLVAGQALEFLLELVAALPDEI